MLPRDGSTVRAEDMVRCPHRRHANVAQRRAICFCDMQQGAPPRWPSVSSMLQLPFYSPRLSSSASNYPAHILHLCLLVLLVAPNPPHAATIDVFRSIH